MAERKPLFMSADGYAEEMAQSDTATFGGLTLGGAIAMGGNKITGLGSPTVGTDAATKSYVDSVAQGLTLKTPALVVATSNITLSGTQTIDGVAVVAGNRVLAAGQTTPSENGVYVVAAGAWARAADMPAGSNAASDYLFVQEGTNYADTGWVCSTDPGSDVVGTNSLTFVQFSSAGAILGGAGLVKTGNTLDVGDGPGILVSADKIEVELSGTPGLEFDVGGDAGKLQAKVDPNQGLQRIAAGLGIKLTGTTLLAGASGLSVKGLPSLFEINGVSVGAGVTAPNLDTLTNGSNADALHAHAPTEAPKVENTLAVAEAIAVADPVYQSATADRVGKARADDTTKSYVVGVARTAQATVGNTSEVVSAGPAAGVLSGATPGQPYYLQSTGGIGTTTPGAGSRVIQCGVAKNATDLFVRIVDFGKKAA
ncbi:MAG: hypothetical protein U0169_11035 [Polyangiaceae bacterium]